jgi:ArsR family transcriptional regulator, arsenate/arsenite/antimonite-responsive transcriptional repressor
MYAIIGILAYMRYALEIFKAVGEETRFRALALLVKADTELCACEIIDCLVKPQYTVSKSMTTLVKAGIVSERRDGKMMYYRLNGGDPKIKPLIASIRAIFQSKDYGWKDDFKRLGKRLGSREKGRCVSGCVK